MADIDGLPQLEARLKAISDTKMMMGRLGLQAVAYAKGTVPRKTGNLGRTIRLGTVSEESVQILAGGQLGVGYARVVEYGSKPHDIYPRRKKALFFTTKGSSARLTGSVRSKYRNATAEQRRAGGVVFSKHVRHPGTKPNPFLRPAAERAVQELGVSVIIEAWNKAA
jgi:hypothetical protein